MKTERVTVASLLFDPANVRKHGERNLDSIKSSLARFGQQKPIVVDGDGIVRAGNGTLMAAKALGWDEIEIVRTNLRGSEATAYAIADNRTAELAEWDEGALAEQLAALQIDDEALAAATGFDASEIERMALPVDVVEDEVPEPPVDPITKPGDLWLLGEHRVLCGDSTKAEDVERLMGGEKPDMVLTDPPYGVEYDPEWHVEAAKKGQIKGAGNRGNVDRIFNDDRADWKEAIALTDADVIYCWFASLKASVVQEALEQCGFVIRSLVVWSKDAFGISRGHYHWQHEPCWYAVKNGQSARWKGDRSQSTIWQIPRGRSESRHPTQKPIECMARPMRNHEAAIVYDPFLGSGTTLIAAEQLGRRCFGMEISPAYCDVIVKRWETLTGKKATLAA